MMRKLLTDKLLKKAFLLITFIFLLPNISAGEIIRADTLWSGEIVLEEDILVPDGITLNISPGTVINVLPSESSKSDPEYMSSLTEITVRGRLLVNGNEKSPVMFHVKDSVNPGIWAGIIIDGGTVRMWSSTIENAETGIYIVNGKLALKDSIVRKNRYGLFAYSEAADIQIINTNITENNYGIFKIDGSAIKYSGAVIRDNFKKDLYIYGRSDEVKALYEIKTADRGSVFTKNSSSCREKNMDLLREYKAENRAVSKKYEDEVLIGDTIWRGRILINGLIRVAENARLIIMPGTIVEFRKKDTNGDGLGENGILLQGLFIAKGNRANPIIFRSAEKNPAPGDWNAINIINSDGAQNLIEFTQIQDAYRGLHFHFSNVMVNESVLKNNYRAIQFQESAVEMRGNYIFGNKSAIKARDSEIVFKRNNVLNNLYGVNFFRTTLRAHENNIAGNADYGIRIREGTTDLQENLVDCNRHGIMINNSFYGKFNRNIITNNYETGVSIKDSDNVELGGNFIQNSGFNGINILSSGAVIKNNHISENGERGIGIQSFSGVITDNSIIRNGLYAIENESEKDISAVMNWWGVGKVSEVLYDQRDDPEIGRIKFDPSSKQPLPYIWPLKRIRADITWQDIVQLKETVEVIGGATLKVSPGTRVILSENTGIKILNSKILSIGEENKNIIYTSFKNDPDQPWDEILIEHSDGSVFLYSIFEYAKWAMHSHFTQLKISDSIFRKNYGGLRFRSGPLEVTHTFFTDNKIGIRSFRGNAAFRKNNITNNEIGIFIREKGSGVIFRNNNIYLNSYYNIRVGDFNIEDIDARENWWGVTEPEKAIFDGRREPGVGLVIYEPYLKEKVVIKSISH